MTENMIQCDIWQDKDCPYYQVTLDKEEDNLFEFEIPKSLYERYVKVMKDFNEIQDLLYDIKNTDEYA